MPVPEPLSPKGGVCQSDFWGLSQYDKTYRPLSTLWGVHGLQFFTPNSVIF